MTRTTRLRPAGLALLLAPLLALGLGVSPGHAAPAGSETPELVVVLDSSGSMAEADAGGGQTRMDAAKQAVVALAAQAPDSARIGLRTYGDAVDSEAPGSCEDTTLKVPVGPVDRAAITAQVQALAPRGDTPIGISLRAAAGDLTGGGPRSIVLVSDGEPTCDLDPCIVAGELAAQGVDLRIDVVGFRVGTEARQILQCVAEAGGGQYVDAGDAGELTAALGTSVDGSFRVYQPEGTPVTGTPAPAGAPVVEEGQYLDRISVGTPLNYQVRLGRGETLRVGVAITRGDDGSRRGVGGFVAIRTIGPDGRQCANTLDVGGVRRGTSPATGSLLHGAEWRESDRPSCTSGTVVVEVEWTNASDTGALPMELVVDVEPAVVQAPPPQQAVNQQVDYQAPAKASGPAVPVVGGGSFNDALVLEPGLHSDSMRSGETVFYRVPVGWGQQLAVRVDFPTYPDDAPLRSELGSSTYAHLDVHNAQRGSVASVSDAGGRSIAVRSEGGTLHATTHPVAFEGRQETVYAEQWGVSEAGDLYVALSLGRNASTDEGSGLAVPYEVTVDVLGEALDGPEYAGGDPAPEPSATPPSETAVSDDAQDEEAEAEPSPLPSTDTVSAEEGSGVGPALTTGLVVLAVVMFAALMALVGWGALRGRRDAA